MAFIGPVNTAVTLFGLVRLADLVTDLHATQTELAALAVSQQCLRSASRLREAIGDRLETVNAHAKAGPGGAGPDQARGQLTAAAGIARQALDQVWEVVAGDDRDRRIRWARRRASQPSTWAGSDERGRYDTGTKPPGKLEHFPDDLVPSMSGVRASAKCRSVGFAGL